MLLCQLSNPAEACGDNAAFSGSESTRGNWPWLAALHHKQKLNFICGANLISSRLLLIAAHCLRPKSQNTALSTSEVIAYLGKHELTDSSEKDSIVVHPSTFIFHDEWKEDDLRYDADIALIVLTKEVLFNSNISPICTWHSHLDNNFLSPNHGFAVRKFFFLLSSFYQQNIFCLISGWMGKIIIFKVNIYFEHIF